MILINNFTMMMQLKKNCDGDDDDGDEHDGDDDEVLVIGEKSCYSPLDFPRRQMRSFNRIPIFLSRKIFPLFLRLTKHKWKGKVNNEETS